MKKIASLLIRLLVTSLILTVLFLKINFRQVSSTIATCNFSLFSLAFLIFISCYYLGLLRWQMLLHALDLKPPLRKIVIAFSGGLFFNLVMPSTIGGDVARTYTLFSHTKEGGKVAATVILDRLSGFLALNFIAILSLAFGWRFIDSKLVVLSIAIMTSTFSIIVMLLFSRRASNKLCSLLNFFKLHKVISLWMKVFNAILLFRQKKVVLLKNFIVSILIQGSSVLVFYLIAVSLGAQTRLLYFLILVPIIGAISTLPITIGGLGLRDASTILFFSKVGIAANIALATSLISFFFTTAVGVLGGIIYVLTLHTRRL